MAMSNKPSTYLDLEKLKIFLCATCPFLPHLWEKKVSKLNQIEWSQKRLFAEGAFAAKCRKVPI